VKENVSGCFVLNTVYIARAFYSYFAVVLVDRRPLCSVVVVQQ